MFALLRNVPGMNHPVVRIVIGLAITGRTPRGLQ